MNREPDAPQESEAAEPRAPDVPGPEASPEGDGAAPEKPRKRGCLVRIVANVILLALSFLLLEGLIRITPYNPRTSALLSGFVNPEWRDTQIFELHPELFWRFRPNQVITGKSDEAGVYEIPINNLGFRGPHFPDGKEAGRVRVMHLGDSCVFGWSAPVRQNFPERLHGYLSAEYPDRKFHFFQGGVPGYSSYQAKQVLEMYGKDYDPHLVIIYLGTNDCMPAVRYPDDEVMSRGWLVWNGQRTLEKSYLYCGVRDFILNPDPMTDEEWHNRYESLDWEEGVKRVSPDDFSRNLAWMVEYARQELDARVILVTRQSLRPEPAVAPYNKRMEEVGKTLNVPVVDVASYFAQVPEPEQLYYKPEFDKIHPNSRGYGIIAQLVLSEIRENEMVEKTDP